MTAPITTLVVDNEPGFADLAAEMLEREDEILSVETATSADEALSALETTAIDCIVSDYEMPGTTGLELLEAVRERDPDLPFVLFTGKGSEEIASEAIAAGVTQYLRKKPGRDRYTLLANQITNAVSQVRAEAELRESERRYERILTALHESTRDLMRAGTKDEIYRSTVETAGEILDIPIVAVYAFDPETGSLSRTASTVESGGGDVDSTIERGQGIVWSVFSEGAPAYYEDVRSVAIGDVPGTDDDTVDDPAGADGAIGGPKARGRSELIVPLGTHGVLVAGSETVDGVDETVRELTHILSANAEAALDRAEREGLLREHDRTLTRQNEELTRLDNINEVVRGINRAVAEASTRRDIERAVCDRIAETDRYRFAWIASTEEEPPSPSAWAGVDAAYVDRIGEGGDRSPEVDLVRRAVEDGAVAIVDDVLDEDDWERRRTEALTYGFQTVVAIPLVDSERSYGALVVHAPASDAITGGEREVLAELGETIGHAVRSVERTRAMVTDSRLELTLECGDDRLLLNRLSLEADARITVEGVIDREAESIVVFARIPDAPVETLCALEETWATVETVSVVSESDDATLFELTGGVTPLVETLREYDARLRSAEATAGTSDLVVALPGGADARSFVEAVRDRYPETDLAARRETETTRTPGGLDTTVRDRLTARQFEALQAAHFGGFYDWPRESTGEDLAAALDVSPPTYHHHRRAAERKLVDLVFDSYSN